MRCFKALLLAFLGLIALLDLVVHARAALYSGDEIFNLDASMAFLRTGNYTTSHFGGVPFDPVISSGIVATWPQGLVMLLGGNLFTARVLSGMLHLACACGCAFAYLRTRGLSALDAWLVALAIWVAALPVGGHELRITNTGEMWGAILLAVGLLLAQRSLRAAAFAWGVAVWLCKIIYLPFAGALLIAALAAPAREHTGAARRSSATARNALALAGWFLAPLLLWMAVIALRHGLHTVLAWCVSYVVFTVKHATGISLDVAGLPTLAGWRFEPDWAPAPSILVHGRHITLPYLIPLALGPLLASVYLLFAVRDRPLGSPRRCWSVASAAAAVAAFAVWFLGFDPTQWGRHLLPAVYVSLGLATYCSVEMWHGNGRSSPALWSLAVLVSVALVGLASARTLAYAHTFGWKGSYAKTCAGWDVLARPCMQDATLVELSAAASRICGYRLPSRSVYPECARQGRRGFLEYAIRQAAHARGDVGASQTAGYMILYIEHLAYDDRRSLLADLTAVVCRVVEGRPARDTAFDPGFDAYLSRAGHDLQALIRACADARPPAGEPTG